jgi:RHS repeat-associated protein
LSIDGAAETGLNLNYFRDYDPQTGRYIEPDPIGLDGGSSSTYIYTGNNPVSWTDSFGLSTLVYNSTSHTLAIYDYKGQQVGTYPAYNNTTNPVVDPQSAGPYPEGTYAYTGPVDHGTDPNSSYGAYGAYRFPRPGCPNCEVHSGRANKGGPSHVTQGCVRSTDDATKTIRALISIGDPPAYLTVIK